MTTRPTLTEPLEVAKFWKNRKGEAIIVTLKNFEGRSIIDIRTHFTTKDGKFQPTGKGLALMALRLPELAKAINKALAKAKELGLIDDEGEQ
jgi:transcriptional coactivator p15 (PC4)